VRPREARHSRRARRHRRQQGQAAAILEIDRSTLYKKLKDYDIES
jgi:DNA-binding protein Fis